MTVTTTSSKVVALGNGVTTVFTYSFLIPAAVDAVVTYTDASGNPTTLLASQYTITGLGNPAGGTVTYPTSGSPIANGTLLTIQRILPLTQGTSISNQGAFYPGVVESGLDTATMQIQQIASTVGSTLQVPSTDPTPGALPSANQRANQMLGFDGSGNPIAAQPSSALVSTAMQPVVAAATTAAAVALLGVSQPPVFVGGTTTGSANAQVLATTTPNTFTMTAGNRLTCTPGFTNTNAMTLTIGVIVANVKVRTSSGPVALVGGEVVANQAINLTSDGTNLLLDEAAVLTSPTITGGSTSGTLIGGTTGTFSGNLTSSGTITAASTFASAGVSSILANNGSSGGVYLRPNGAGSTTGQVVVASSGAVTINGTLTVTG